MAAAKDHKKTKARKKQTPSTASSAPPPPKPGGQGRLQFLSARREMLDAFDRARAYSKAHEVETYHGRVAEAAFRKWLSRFLPKRYALCSGYVISAGLSEQHKAPHYDVIIYDALDAPTLWIESNADASEDGWSRAIPAEHVLAVIEVKAALTRKSALEATKHLADLLPLLGSEPTDERYPKFLTRNFFTVLVFFELRRANDKPGILDTVFADKKIPSLAPIVLRKETRGIDESGRIYPTGEDKEKNRLTGGVAWTDNEFVMFAFDLIARLKDTYQIDRISSAHALSVRIAKI